MWAGLAAGLVGWLLMLSGAGKLTLWAEFRQALEASAVLPPWAARAAGWGAPWAEAGFGIAVLVRPAAWSLMPAAALFLLFAAYQVATLRAGKPADCHCYGKLRQVRSGRPAALGNGLMAAVALAGSWSGADHPVLRAGGGLVLAVAYLWLMGMQAEPRSRFVFAEVRYLQERAAGQGDKAARLVVAQEFGLSPQASYLLLPRSRAAVILVRKRLGLKTTL